MFCLEPDLLQGYKENIRAALWSEDGKYIMSGGEDKAIRYTHTTLSQLNFLTCNNPVVNTDVTYAALLCCLGASMNCSNLHLFLNEIQSISMSM